jgi:hypothetical protein
MNAAIQHGPISGSALFLPARRRDAAASPRRDAKRPRIAARRPIGLGPRAILVTNPACKATPRIAREKPLARRAARRTSLYAGFLGSLLFSAAAFGLTYAVDAPRTLMSRSDYLAARQAIASDARAETGRCRAEAPSLRDVCRAQARATERVRKAQLDARYHGTVASATDAQRVAVKAQFDVTRARCNTLEAESRVQCLQSARADLARALALARAATT